jgi:hypothetical protein
MARDIHSDQRHQPVNTPEGGTMGTARRFMIARRYGPNRDWLCDLSSIDCNWTSGAHRALVLNSREAAERALALVQDQTREWPNADRFQFAVIYERQSVPAYVGSITVPIVQHLLP